MKKLLWGLSLLVFCAGTSFAILQIPAEGGAAKIQAEAVKQQRDEYQLFRFEQEQKQRKTVKVEKREKKTTQAIKTHKEKSYAGLMQATQPGWGEQFLNFAAITIIVLVGGFFGLNLWLRRAPQKSKKQTPDQRKPGETTARSGISVIEMLLVLVFVSVAFLAVLQLLTGSLISSGEMQGSITAQNLANHKIEELMNDNFYSLASETRTTFSDFPDYSYTVTVSSAETHLKNVTVVVYWMVGGQEMSYAVDTMFSDW